MRTAVLVAVGFILVGLSTLSADLIEIGPFVGDNSEDFNAFPWGLGGYATLDIFQGDVTLSKLASCFYGAVVHDGMAVPHTHHQVRRLLRKQQPF